MPTIGAVGVDGCTLITTFAEAGEVHVPLDTVKLYVPAAKPVMVAVVVVPVIVPGIIVQLPVGKPLRTTLPVANAHVGWVIVPITGAVGVVGCVLIVTLVAGDTHPEAFFAVTG